MVVAVAVVVHNGDGCCCCCGVVVATGFVVMAAKKTRQQQICSYPIDDSNCSFQFEEVDGKMCDLPLAWCLDTLLESRLQRQTFDHYDGALSLARDGDAAKTNYSLAQNHCLELHFY